MKTLVNEIKDKEKLDKFILELKELMKKYNITLDKSYNYDGEDNMCGNGRI